MTTTRLITPPDLSANLSPHLVPLVQDRPRWEAERNALTVFDSTGWALEDLVATEPEFEHAERFELGAAVDLLPDPRDPDDPYEALRR